MIARQRLLLPDRPTTWKPETAALIEWFLKTPPPSKPLELYRGVTVLRPGVYWQHLKLDIACGPGRARSHMGTFEKDLARLHELLGGPDHAGNR